MHLVKRVDLLPGVVYVGRKENGGGRYMNGRLHDHIEFYFDDKLIARVKSSFSIIVDQRISIRGKTYIVAAVTFALDYADDFAQRHMRMNVTLVDN
jgi:hypothetical protein